jgi:uncharacterized membrane protein YcjF (UPF0283 family)
MKPSNTDYLSITAALVAILLCGYGIGFLVGERTTTLRLASKTSAEQSHSDWSAATVDRLTRELQLTPDQQSAIKQEIGMTAEVIADTRHNAIREYRAALIELHERMLPHLDGKQRRHIKESQAQLQSLLDNERARGN